MTTVANWISGLAYWHHVHGAPWSAGRHLQKVTLGVQKLQPLVKPLRPPVTLKHMEALREGLDLTDAFDAAVSGVATAAFWGSWR